MLGIPTVPGRSYGLTHHAWVKNRVLLTPHEQTDVLFSPETTLEGGSFIDACFSLVLLLPKVMGFSGRDPREQLMACCERCHD